MRRLNQVEYENTVRDLLGVDVELKDVLPVDSTAGGFDTSAETLHVSSYLLHNYLRAAERVLDAAVAGGPRPAQVKRRFDLKAATRQQGVSRQLDDGVAIFASDLSSNIQTVLWDFLTRDRGKYRFRISAYAYQSEKPVIFHVNGGTDDLGEEPYLIGYFDVPPDKPTVVEFVEQMEARRNIRHPGRHGDAGADPAAHRGGELQGAGGGLPVGRNRRPAGRFLAAAESSNAVRRHAAGAGSRQSQSPRGRLAATAGRRRGDPAKVYAAGVPSGGDRRRHQRRSSTACAPSWTRSIRSSRRCGLG